MLSGAFSTTIFPRSSIERPNDRQLQSAKWKIASGAYTGIQPRIFPKAEMGLQVHRFPDNKDIFRAIAIAEKYICKELPRSDENCSSEEIVSD
jgi:hypothetical protein